MRGKPHPVMLESGFISIASLARMSTDIEHRWQLCAFLCVFRQIKVPRHVEPRAALKMQLLDAESFLAIDGPGGLRVERRPFGQGPEPEHFEVFPPQLRPARFPLLAISYPVEKFAIQPHRLVSEK